MEMKLKVLLLEDLPTDVELVSRQLRTAGMDCEIACVADEPDFRHSLETFAPDVILSDFSLPSFDGLRALDIARSFRPDIPYIFVSGTIGEERAIESIQRGATDYVLKSNLRRLPAAIERALDEARKRAALDAAERALRSSEERFRLLVNGVADYAIFMLDAAGRLVSWNPGAQRLLGYSEAEVLGRSYGEFHALVEDGARTGRSAEALLSEARGSGHVRAEGLLARKAAPPFWANVSITALHDDDRTVRGFAVVTRDISERKANEAKIARLSRIHAVLSGINAAIVRIRDREELFREACRIAVDDGNFAIAWIDEFDAARGTVRLVAHAGEDVSWIVADAAQAQPRPARGLVAEALRHRRVAYSNDLAAEPDGDSPRRKETIRRGYRSAMALPLCIGERVVGELMLVAREAGFFNEDEIKLLSQLAADISFALDHIEKEERLDYLAYYDALTGLPNRTLFQDRLGQLVQSHRAAGTRLAVVFADIPRFRRVNESLGRGAGDAVLQEIARRFSAVWPDEGSAARVGPNAFVAVMQSAREEAQLAHQLEASVARIVGPPVRIGSHELSVMLTCGIALYPDDAATPDELLRNAEAAAKRARIAGERYLFYEPDMNARIAHAVQIENKLRRALEHEQFVLHYQPKLDVRTRRVVGLEALIRWLDPDTGLVPPLQFIPVLEETGLILEAGRWVIEQAVREYAHLRAAGIACPRIAVNVSAVQLRRRDFVQAVERAIAAAPPSGHGLDVEITETLAMADVTGNIPKLQALKDMGVGIAIDDFGTGYSSLAYISRLPVDSLKIDRSFIVNMERSAHDRAIVSTVIALAHDLGLTAIAEGVDAESQAQLLEEAGCDQMQGYLFSRPVPAEQLEAVLQKLG